MLIQLFGLIDGLGSLADWLVGGVELLYSAGMPRGVDPGALVVGGTVGGVVGGGAVSGGAGGGGSPASNRARDLRDPMRNPRVPGPEDDVGDATFPSQQMDEEYGPDHDVRRPPGPLERIARQNQKWAEQVMGVDTVGTVPGGGKA